MSVIKLMEEDLANKIAAGEVVEKCASVVKELVENSIDAGSSEIYIDLKESGTKEIIVKDNGCGMDHDDAINCFNRHATSKIKNLNDLYHINTLGFRGEALASIASVAKVELITSEGNVGTMVEINGGKVINVKNSDALKGTTIKVADLFYNTPARLKYLKSLYTELANIVDLINRIALSHPDIKFVLTNDDKVLLNTEGKGNLLKVINAIYGISVTKKMIEINGENEDYQVSGYISSPEIHKSNRNSIITIVNGRVVKNQELNRYINDAYHSYKPDNRYPIVVININVDETLIDVNIHPTKMDIKFSSQDGLNNLIYDLIRNAITKKTLIPNADILTKEDYFEAKKQEEIVKPNYDNLTIDFNTFDVKEEEIPYNEESSVDNNLTYEEEPLFINENLTDNEKYPFLEVVGLVHGTYIIAQNEIGMYLIDEHAAKERINYEIISEKIAQKNNDTISLLVPLTLEFTNAEFIILKNNLDFIRSYGFEIEEFGLSSFIIKSHPTWIPDFLANDLIKRFLDIVVDKEKKFDLKTFNDHMAATMACKMSIKANTNITKEEMEHLLKDLAKCKNPFNCPHGRPTTIKYTKYEIEKMFKRTGF